MPDWHPTLLRMPSWLGYVEERELPLLADAYEVTQVRDDWWKIKIRRTGETIYEGIGPVEVFRSPAPF